jgi:hypothetical protein
LRRSCRLFSSSSSRTPLTDLEKVMRDAFADYKTTEHYDGTPEEIVHRVCAILGVEPDPDLWPAPGTVPAAPPKPVIKPITGMPVLKLREDPPIKAWARTPPPDPPD